MNEPHQTENDISQPRTIPQYLRLFFTGFAMGSADIVPGVSGGTMAFILGVYEALINGIKSFNLEVFRRAIKFDIRGAIDLVPLRFLITLGLGIGTAIILLANVLHSLLENQPTYLFAFFGGLIAASILAIGVKVKWSPASAVALVLAAVFAFGIAGFDDSTLIDDVIEAARHDTGLKEAQAALVAELKTKEFDEAEAAVAELIAGIDSETDTETFQDEMEAALYEASSPVTLFFSGMLAICAMILPGISGSFILLILGQYAAVLGAVNNIDIIRIGAVGAGAGIGIILFSRVISWLLKQYENVTIAALVGFMTGSIWKIWLEAVDGVDLISDDGQLTGGQWALVIALIAIGFVAVSLLDHLQSRSNPLITLVWKTPDARQVEVTAEKAEALD